MKEIIKGISFQEYNLTIVRIATFLSILDKDHKKLTTKDRLILFDFYLKYPELTSNFEEKIDFDTKYSYFHWKPNYRLYSASLADLKARELIFYSSENGCYYITDRGNEFVLGMGNTYVDKTKVVSEYINKNILKLSNKAIMEDIENIILKKRGIDNETFFKDI
ncbi:hypothetical protein HB911_01495 [Listeria booriae]|uniref:ABC-three component system middle component 2 n=1 Tax=Listeria booriae TaxID=1552123 RepID=UPI00162A3CA1|nr:ABC-three component system middle component 2 [Listeria booriae]MBC1557369.1 hypothetical protein [Listeria booriae]